MDVFLSSSTVACLIKLFKKYRFAAEDIILSQFLTKVYKYGWTWKLSSWF